MIRSASETRRYLRAMGLEAAVDVREIIGGEPRQILVVGMKRIGDLIVILPSIQALHDHFPSSNLTVMSSPDHEPVLRALPYVDSFECLPLSPDDFYRSVKSYDLILQFRDWYAPPKPSHATPFHFSFSTRLLYGLPKPAYVHYLDALRLLGVNSRRRRPRIVLDAESRQYAARFFSAFEFTSRYPVVAVHPGGSYEGKRWPADRYCETVTWLRNTYDARFLVVRGHDSDRLVEKITKDVPEEYYAVIGELPLLKVAALLARCTFFLGNDSGIMHLADAVGLPTLTIFGPSRPGVWGAAGNNAVHLVRDDIWNFCPECSTRHLRDIPCRRPSELSCLRAIRVEDVLAAIEALAALMGLRERFEHLDAIRLTKNLDRSAIGEDGLMISNLRMMRPLIVFHDVERVERCLEAVEKHGSYEKILEERPENEVLLEALLSYRIVLPDRDAEESLEEVERSARAEVLHDPYVIRLNLGLNGDAAPGSTQDLPLRQGNAGLSGSRAKKKRLRVLFVNGVRPSVYGGGERWMLNVAVSLTKRGHEVLCWGVRGHRWLNDAQQRGVLCLTRPIPTDPALHKLAETQSYLKTLEIDAAILNKDEEAFCVGLPLRLAKVPVVWVRKGLAGFRDTPTIRWAYQHVVDGIVTPSKQIREETVREGWVEASRIHTIANGVDLSRFDRPPAGLETLRRDLDLKSDHKVILTIGRLAHQKGITHLIGALPQICRQMPEARLLVVGQGPEAKNLREKAVEKGVDWAVRFAGERWDVQRMFGLAACYVQASLYEGMSTAILEAMAAGVPVVATSVYGATDVIEDGVTGLLVRPANSAALAKAVHRVLNDGHHASRMAEEARRVVKSKYSFESMVDKVEELLRFGLRMDD